MARKTQDSMKPESGNVATKRQSAKGMDLWTSENLRGTSMDRPILITSPAWMR